MEILNLEASQSDIRIDKYLVDQLDLSRSYIQQLIKEKCVLVDEEVVKSNYKLKKDQKIEIRIEDPKPLEIKPIKMDLDIVYEDDSLLVINKGKNLIVHPSTTTNEPTLVHALLAHCKELSGINGVARPGIVHRIDKDTTGLLVVAKTDKAHTFLSEQLADKTMHREYVALVHGNLKHDFATIDAPIGRDLKNRKLMSVNEKGKDAITHIEVIQRFKQYTLIKCKLETGRTHQIRVHLHYIGHPIVGDEKYSYRKTLKTNGQMLHAQKIEFVHPVSKELVSFSCELPTLFNEILKELEND